MWSFIVPPLFVLSCIGATHGIAGALQDVAAVNVQSEAATLTRGAVIERQMSTGESHAFKVMLAPGQYLRILIEQRGIDVNTVLTDPDGRQLLEMNSPGGAHGPEYVSTVAEKAGNYLLVLDTAKGRSVTGRYELRIEELRAATAGDNARVSAEKTFAEGAKLLSVGTQQARTDALAKFDGALQYWKTHRDPHWEAATLYSMGVAHRRLGALRLAEKFFQEARSLPLDARDWRLLASVWNDSGINYADLGEHQLAVEALNRAMSMYRDKQDVRGQGSASNLLGLVYLRVGKNKEALAYYENALALRREEKDREGEALLLNNIGGVYRTLSEPHRALDHFSRGQQILKSLDESGQLLSHELLGAIYNNIALAYDDMSEWQWAIENYEKALKIFRIGGNIRSIAATLGNIGQLYNVLGDPTEAVKYLDEALKLSEEVKDPGALSEILIYTGQAHISEGNANKALSYFTRARDLKINSRTRANTLTNIGMARALQGEARAALGIYDEALSLQQGGDNRRGEAATLQKRGEAYSMLGEHERARVDFDQSLSLSRAIADPLGEAAALNGLARVERDRDNLTGALKLSDKALGVVESLRTRVASQRLRTSYFATSQNYYEVYIDVRMQLYRRTGAPEHATAALQASERARARSLIDTLLEAGVDIRQGVSDDLLRQAREVQQKLNVKASVQTKLLSEGKATGDQAAAVKREIANLISEYDSVLAKIRRASPKYAGLTQPPSPALADIQQRLLDDDTLLLEFALGDEKSHLWIVGKTNITGYELPKRAEIERIARSLYASLVAPQPESNEDAATRRRRIEDASEQYDTQAAALSDMLLGKAARQLGRKRLLIVSDGILQYIPFNALPLPVRARAAAPRSPGRQPRIDPTLLIEEHEIVSLPSATALMLMSAEAEKHRSVPRSVAVFADPIFEANDRRLQLAGKTPGRPEPPDSTIAEGGRSGSRQMSRMLRSELELRRLWLTKEEAEAIKTAAAPGQVKLALGFEARRAAVMNLTPGKYSVVHFATHGFLDSAHPELSGIALSLFDENGNELDGILRLHDIYNLKLSTDLVVLSACSTGLGRIVKGEGLIGLTRGFMYAGALRVVASLWRVDDFATSLMMKRFYEYMLKDRMSPAAALRRAQIDLLKEKRWRTPYFWASFVLQGEWRRIG